MSRHQDIVKSSNDAFEDLLTPGPRRPVRVRGADLMGIEARGVWVEASAHGESYAPPRILGLPDAAVRESYHRVHTAFRSLGIAFPRGHVVVNLAPASTRKAGSGFDLAIALALASLAGAISDKALATGLFLGELGLDGSLRPVQGILPMLEYCVSQRIPRLYCPDPNATLAQEFGADCEIVPLRDLREALVVLSGQFPPRRPQPTARCASPSGPDDRDWSRVRGQQTARDALVLAAAGGHHILLSGPPGCGKTLLARCLPSLLPPLPRLERLEIARIHSAFASLEDEGLARILSEGRRPFRAPHHTTSFAGLVGGGQPIQPGEITRAHRGVLFLDELPEFARNSLEALREPLEEGRIALRRARGGFELPARFQLIVAMNPCPCGMLGHPTRPCRDSPRQVEMYRGRISGPLLDRIDIQLALRPVAPEALLDAEPLDLAGSSTETSSVRARIAAIHELSYERNDGRLNAQLDEQALRSQLTRAARRLLLATGRGGRMSARSLVRVLRVARTAADLAGAESIDEEAIATAMHYRMRVDGTG